MLRGWRVCSNDGRIKNLRLFISINIARALNSQSSPLPGWVASYSVCKVGPLVYPNKTQGEAKPTNATCHYRYSDYRCDTDTEYLGTIKFKDRQSYSQPEEKR